MSNDNRNRNAISHGVFSREALFPWEDPEQFKALGKAVAAEHQPATPEEQFLVEELVVALWKGRRARSMEAIAIRANPFARVLEKNGVRTWSEAFALCVRLFEGVSQTLDVIAAKSDQLLKKVKKKLDRDNECDDDDCVKELVEQHAGLCKEIERLSNRLDSVTKFFEINSPAHTQRFLKVQGALRLGVMKILAQLDCVREGSRRLQRLRAEDGSHQKNASDESRSEIEPQGSSGNLDADRSREASTPTSQGVEPSRQENTIEEHLDQALDEFLATPESGDDEPEPEPSPEIGEDEDWGPPKK